MDITVVDSILFFNEYVKDGLAPAVGDAYAVGVTLPCSRCLPACSLRKFDTLCLIVLICSHGDARHVDQRDHANNTALRGFVHLYTELQK